MAEEKSKGLSLGRVAVAGLVGILGSIFFPAYYYPIRLATLANGIFSTAYVGIEAVIAKETSRPQALADGVSHFAGRTVGDFIQNGISYSI